MGYGGSWKAQWNSNLQTDINGYLSNIISMLQITELQQTKD
jgi:hypothetical protein